MLKLRHQTRLGALLKIAAAVAFIGYCSWNAFWLCHGRLAPSIWSSVSGLPCPSSGVVRSVSAALAGEYRDFILYNPFTIPFLFLFILSAYKLIRVWKETRKLLLPAFVGRLWLIALVTAWLAKFVIGKQYW